MRWLGLVLGLLLGLVWDLASDGGFEAVRFGNAMMEGQEGGDSSHQPSRSRARGRRDRRNETGMIFVMGERMQALLAGGLSHPLRICGFLCRFCARPLAAPIRCGQGMHASKPFLAGYADAMRRLSAPAVQKNRFRGRKTHGATTSITAAGAAKSELETSTIRAISWRLIPFLVLAYFFSYLDRVNVGFAALTMNAGFEILADDVRLGRRHFLHRLFHLRGAEQSGAGEIRRQPLDRPHHGDLGHHLGADVARQRRVELLHPALPARRRPKPVFSPASSSI